jgi:hypothetical protein
VKSKVRASSQGASIREGWQTCRIIGEILPGDETPVTVNVAGFLRLPRCFP